MAKKGFTGSEIYFQDKFDEFDFWSRYNNMRPKEGFAQMWKDYKDSTKMEEDEWGKPPPIPLSVLKSGLGFILKQLAGGKFNEGRRDFLEKIIKPKEKIKLDNPKEFKFDYKGIDELKKKLLNKIYMNKNRTLHAKGGLAGMLGEPRSGYQGGGGAGYQDKWKTVWDIQQKLGEYNPEVLELSLNSFLDFLKKQGYYGYKEGGRIGMQGGGWPGLLYQILKYGGKKLWNSKFLNKKRIPSPTDLADKTLKAGPELRTRNLLGQDKWVDIPPFLRNSLYVAGGGTGVASLLKYLKHKLGSIDKLKEDNILQDFVDNEGVFEKAQGGRIGLADGMTPSESWMRNFFFSERGEKYENRMSFKQFEMGPGKDLWLDFIGKAKGGRIGYDNGGPVMDLDHWAQLIFQKPYDQLTSSQQDHLNSFKPEKAEGGRIGFQDGRGIMSRVGDMVDIRNVPYYGGKTLQGLVNSAETLSKFPFAAGELGSKLIQQKPKKEMFMEAIEDITPGSWSENVGLTSLIEDMEKTRPEDAKTVGGILGLGTEIAVPTGGAFKGGQILLDKASKAMGKVKDGKTLNKLVEDKISDSGQSRRDFMSMVGTGGLMAGLKWLGLGSLLKTTAKLKPSDDVVMRLRTFIDDSDVDTEWGPVATGKWGGVFDVEGLSKAAQKTLVGIMKDVKAFHNKATGKKNLVDSYDDINTDDAAYILDALKKAGHKVKFEHLDEAGGMGVDDVLKNFKEGSLYKGTKEGAEKYKKFKEKVKKMSAKEKFEYHNDITDDYGHHLDEGVEDFADLYYEVKDVGIYKKAEGGRIGLNGGGPPIMPVQLGPLQLQPRASASFTTGQPYGPNLREKTWTDQIGIGGMLDLPGGFSLTGDYDKFRTKDRLYTADDEYVDERVRGDHDAWNIGLNWKKEFADGGLTKTVPPKKGPMPQGLPSALYNGIMRSRSY